MSIYEQLTGVVDDIKDFRKRGGFTPQLHGALGQIGEAASYFLSPRGRQTALNVAEVVDMMNPVSDTLDAMEMSGEGDYLGAGVNVAGVVLPAGIVAKYGPQTALAAGKAIQETLTGTGDSLGQVGADVYETFIQRMNQPGPMPTVGSNFGNIGKNAAPSRSTSAPDEIPKIKLSDLEGARVGVTVADLLKAGDPFTGIDASLIDEPEVMMGGPGYPLLQSSLENDLIWASQGKHVQTKKLGKLPDVIAVSAMNPKSHQSNISFANSALKNMQAYVRDGRIPPDNISELNKMVRSATNDAKNSVPGLDKFPGFDSPNINEFLKNASFEQRKRISQILGTKEALKLGAPNINRITEETLDSRFAGASQGDSLLFLKPDLSRDPVDLAAEGLPVHPSYRYGIMGEVLGQLDQPLSTFNLFSDFWSPLGIDEAGTAFNKGGRRKFDLDLPAEEITGEKVKQLEELMQVEAAAGKRFSNADIRVLKNSVVGAWKTSLDPVNKNGVSPQLFVDAIENSKYKPALTNYSAADVTAGKKNGTFEVFQLGEDNLFFGIDKAPDYSWMGVEMQPSDKSLVGVVSNVPGVKGQAVPAVMAKAIEEGVTMLDAFAVKSERFPNGFLPSYYSRFGFEEAGRIPFSKEFYIEDHGEQAYKDLLQAWKSDGWSEDQGFPDLVVMRWSGNDADRASAAASIRGASAEGTGSKAGGFVAEAEGSSGSGADGDLRGEPSGDGRGTGGAAGTSGTSSAQGTGSGVQGILAGLTERQLKNRGLKQADIDELRGVLDGLRAQ